MGHIRAVQDAHQLLVQLAPFLVLVNTKVVKDTTSLGLTRMRQKKLAGTTAVKVVVVLGK